METSHPLWTVPDEELGEYYEARVLRALGWERDRPPTSEVARAYTLLSERLNREQASEPSGHFVVEPRLEAALRGAWLLIYGLRTVFVARRLLHRWPVDAEMLTELGAGSGPFGLVAAARGLEVDLVDLDASALRASRRLYEAFDLPAPRIHVADARSFASVRGATALPYTALEWGGTLEERVSAVRQTLGRGGFLVERGTRPGGHFVQAVRDALPDRVRAPCPSRSICSLADRPRDWCHMTWRLRPGPWTTTIADQARRRWHELHVSFLVVGVAPVSKADMGRVLSVRPEGRQKLVADICSSEGMTKLVALRRRATAFEMLSSWVPGDWIEWDREAVERRGDGLRVVNSSAIRHSRS